VLAERGRGARRALSGCDERSMLPGGRADRWTPSSSAPIARPPAPRRRLACAPRVLATRHRVGGPCFSPRSPSAYRDDSAIARRIDEHVFRATSYPGTATPVASRRLQGTATWSASSAARTGVSALRGFTREGRWPGHGVHVLPAPGRQGASVDRRHEALPSRRRHRATWTGAERTLDRRREGRRCPERATWLPWKRSAAE